MGWQAQLLGWVHQHAKGLVAFGKLPSVCLWFLGEPSGKPEGKAWLMPAAFFRWFTVGVGGCCFFFYKYALVLSYGSNLLSTPASHPWDPGHAWALSGTAEWS